MPLRRLTHLLLTAAIASLPGAQASTRFIELASIEPAHAPGERAAELGEVGYLQLQVSSNLGDNAERLKFDGDDAPKLIVVTAKRQPNAGPAHGNDQEDSVRNHWRRHRAGRRADHGIPDFRHADAGEVRDQGQSPVAEEGGSL